MSQALLYDCLEYTELKLYDGAGEYSSQLCVKAGLQGQVIDSPQDHRGSQTAVHTRSYQGEVLNKPNMQTPYSGIPGQGIKLLSTPVHWLINERMPRHFFFLLKIFGFGCLVVILPGNNKSYNI